MAVGCEVLLETYVVTASNYMICFIVNEWLFLLSKACWYVRER